MHPRQAQLIAQAQNVVQKTAAKKSGAPTLWKYTDPDGVDFYLTKKETGSIKSPYSGKSFPAKPEKFSLSDVGQEMKSDAKAEKAEKSKKAALLDLLNGKAG